MIDNPAPPLPSPRPASAASCIRMFFQRQQQTLVLVQQSFVSLAVAAALARLAAETETKDAGPAWCEQTSRLPFLLPAERSAALPVLSPTPSFPATAH